METTDNVDALRAQLNESLERGNAAEAVMLAKQLKVALLARGTLDERDKKSLAGVESILQLSGEQPTPGKARWGLIAVLVLVAVAVVVFALRPASDFDNATRRMLDKLDKVDNAVTAGVKLADYEAVTHTLKEDSDTYHVDYFTEHGTDVFVQAIAMTVTFDLAIRVNWMKAERLAGNTFTISDPVKFAEFPLGWRIAHQTLTLANTSFRKDKAPVTRSLSTLAGRLSGHWGDGKTEFYFGPVTDQGVAWTVTRDVAANRLDVGVILLEMRPNDEAQITRIGKYHEAQYQWIVTIPTDGSHLVNRTTNQDLKRLDDNTVP